MNKCKKKYAGFYDTGQGNDFYLKDYNKTSAQNSTFYKRIRKFNVLGTEIKNPAILREFKNRLRKVKLINKVDPGNKHNINEGMLLNSFCSQVRLIVSAVYRR